MRGAASFEKINYSIRPAKATQRRMIVEAIGRLSAIAPLHRYQYIGFGSTFFVDFKLLHRQYGIKHMVSVEIEDEKAKRFVFNKPYSCVKMHFGSAASFFSSSEMNWQRPSIIWLDYDYRMSSSVLADLDRVVERVAPGSMLLVTVDADPPGPPMEQRREALEEEIDIDALLQYVGGGIERLGGWGLAKAYHGHASASLKSTLRSVRPDSTWRQTFHFRYADGHKMLTFGGVLLDESVGSAFARCHFKELPFHSSGPEAFEIEIPNLTAPEIHRLAQKMPRLTKRDRESLAKLAIKNEDVESYHALYRYLPTFVESQV